MIQIVFDFLKDLFCPIQIPENLDGTKSNLSEKAKKIIKRKPEELFLRQKKSRKLERQEKLKWKRKNIK